MTGWERVPKHLSYSATGLMLAAGAPAGMILVRAARARQLSIPWLTREVRDAWLDYLYVSGSTAVAFALWGWVLGFRADDLIRLSTEDPLTGLLNARGFKRRLEQELAHASRTGERLSLMVFDLDGLKAINDTYGHATGDRALRTLGDIIRRATRLMDVAARPGGDEFALIVPCTGPDEALLLAERIRQHVADSLSHLVSATTGGTTSIGVACCEPDACASAAALVNAADDALYEAKRSGRNRVAIRRLEVPAHSAEADIHR